MLNLDIYLVTAEKEKEGGERAENGRLLADLRGCYLSRYLQRAADE